MSSCADVASFISGLRQRYSGSGWLVVGMVVGVALGSALLPLPIVGLLLGGVLVVPLVFAEPVVGLCLAILSVPVQELVQLPGGLSCTQVAMVLAVGAWGLQVLAHPERALVRGHLFPLWCVLLWALLLASSFSPYSQVAAFKETLRWAEAFLVWWITVTSVRCRWQVVGVVACLLLAPAADALLGLVQFATGDGPPSFRIDAQVPFVRAYGTIGQPNSFAGYMNMAWALALALALGASVRWWRMRQRRWAMPRIDWAVMGGLWVVVALLLAALVASLSRGAWLGALVGVFGMLVAQGRRMLRWLVVVAGVALLLLGLVAVGVLPPVFAARLTSMLHSVRLFDVGSVEVTPANFSVVERMAQIQAGWRMFLAHPITGVGPGNYTSAYYDVAVLPWYSSRGHAHNYYLHMAAEAGVVGVLAFLALLVGLVYQAWRTLCGVEGLLGRGVAIGCCGIMAAVVGHDVFENLHVLSMGIHLAAVWGLLVVIADGDGVARGADGGGAWLRG